VRYGADRAREIEESSRGLVAWYSEFVGAVFDNNGVSIKDDLDQFMAELEATLRPLEAPKPVPTVPAARCKRACVYRNSTCIFCGWSN